MLSTGILYDLNTDVILFYTMGNMDIVTREIGDTFLFTKVYSSKVETVHDIRKMSRVRIN